jgi:5-methylcytosine-specific restriction protein A
MPRLKIAPPRIATVRSSRVPVPPKTVAQHYTTTALKAWSAAALRRAGYKCEKCSRSDGRLYADHKRELRDGGAALDLGNAQILCAVCHQKKTARARSERMRV